MSATNNLKRACVCLRLEVSQSVADDVQAKADAVIQENDALRAEVERLTHHLEAARAQGWKFVGFDVPLPDGSYETIPTLRARLAEAEEALVDNSVMADLSNENERLREELSGLKTEKARAKPAAIREEKP